MTDAREEYKKGAEAMKKDILDVIQKGVTNAIARGGYMGPITAGVFTAVATTIYDMDLPLNDSL